MSDFFSELTNRWDFDESSGLLLDKIGSRDSDSVDSAPNRTPQGTWILDGVDDGITFLDASSPYPAGATYTNFLAWRAKIDPDGAILLAQLEEGGALPFKRGHGFQDNGGLQTNAFRILWGGFPSIDLTANVGRALLLDEWVVSAFSWNTTTNFFQQRVKTDGGGGTPIDLSASGTPGGDPLGQDLFLGRNRDGTVFYNIEYFQMGTINGSTKTNSELGDHIDQVHLNIIDDFASDDSGPIGGSGRTNFRLDSLRQTRWNRGVGRFM